MLCIYIIVRIRRRRLCYFGDYDSDVGDGWSGAGWGEGMVLYGGRGGRVRFLMYVIVELDWVDDSIISKVLGARCCICSCAVSTYLAGYEELLELH